MTTSNQDQLRENEPGKLEWRREIRFCKMKVFKPKFSFTCDPWIDSSKGSFKIQGPCAPGASPISGFFTSRYKTLPGISLLMGEPLLRSLSDIQKYLSFITIFDYKVNSIVPYALLIPDLVPT